jgi:endonuclease-3
MKSINFSSKITRIQSVLNQLYPNPPIPLNFNSPFQLLCAVILSAQTTDGKVNNVTQKLFELAPTPQLMAQLPYDRVLDIILPVGLAPKKSKFLVDMSKILIDKFDGEVPSTFDALESLPGVGHKTASGTVFILR